MKAFYILLLLPFFVFSQKDADHQESLFVALYTVGENWDLKKGPDEQTHFKSHSSFLKQLRDDDIISQGARFGDTGMVIFKATDLADAKALIHSDVAIQNRLFNVEVHKFAPFYKGCIE